MAMNNPTLATCPKCDKINVLVCTACGLCGACGTHENCNHETLVNKPTPDTSGIEMVFVECGTFLMGTPLINILNASARNERPAHSVSLSSFYIGKYSVTQKEWQAVMGNNPSCFKEENCTF